jgi:hypothetical protein
MDKVAPSKLTLA